MIDYITEIDSKVAKAFISQFHYSKVMPRITKHCIGGYVNNKLVAVCTLGYGVRPLHTIKKIFPVLGVIDYLEIGKLCLDDACPRNTESFFISKVVKWCKQNVGHVKILFSWADGIIGKPGFVYQASNFYYGGYIWTEMYLDSKGNRVHPRSMQGLTNVDSASGSRFQSRSYEATTAIGYTKYFGLQFRYVYPLCNDKEWRKLIANSEYTWERKNYPKDVDCVWKIQTGKGKREACGKPPFVMTEYVKENDNKVGLKLFFNGENK